MKQVSLIKSSLTPFLVDTFSADNLCCEKARQALEKKYASFLEITDKFNRQSVSYQLSKKDVLHS